MTTTNLSVMDEELAVLAGSSFDTITISCDGCTAEVYEKIRKNGNFERFVKNLDLFMAHAGNVRVILNCVLMRQNICQAPEIVRFAAAHGIKQVVFSDLLTDQDLKNQGDSLELYPALAAKYLEEAEAAAREAGVSLSIGWDYKKEARSFAEEAISKEEAQGQAGKTKRFPLQKKREPPLSADTRNPGRWIREETTRPVSITVKESAPTCTGRRIWMWTGTLPCAALAS